MNLIVGESIHITSEDLKPASETDILKAINDILSWHPQEEFTSEEETPSK